MNQNTNDEEKKITPTSKKIKIKNRTKKDNRKEIKMQTIRRFKRRVN